MIGVSQPICTLYIHVVMTMGLLQNYSMCSGDQTQDFNLLKDVGMVVPKMKNKIQYAGKSSDDVKELYEHVDGG